MRRHTKTFDALLISLILHVSLLIVFSFYFAERPQVFEDALSVVLLGERPPEPRIRKPRLLAKVEPPTPRAMSAVDRSGQMPKHATTLSELTPAALARRESVISPQAPIKADEVPDFVTHADFIVNAKRMLPDASLGEASQATSPSQLGVRRGLGSAGRGVSKLLNRGEDFYKRVADQRNELQPSDPEKAAAPLDVPLGLGIFDTEVAPGRGLIGEVYVPGHALFFIPDFNRFSPVYTFLTANLNIPQREYTRGFPTPTHFHVIENFAVRFRGRIFIRATGRYDFAFIADDGARLYIDGILVVDHDGIHQPTYRRGDVALTAGMHSVEIHYFQGPRFHIALQWFYRPPGQREQIVPVEMLYRP
jgi:hypothetical protein